MAGATRQTTITTFKTILTVAFWTALFSCGQRTFLTEREVQVCQDTSFDKTLAGIIKKQTRQGIERLPEVNEYGEISDAKGIGLCSVSEERAGLSFVIREKERFREKGYLLFIFENNDRQKCIGTIKGTDELGILKWRKPNGINYGLDDKDVLAKLQDWKQKNDLIILGAGMDWLHFQFKTMPADIAAFAEEVYEFCPDAIDQGAGDMPHLIAAIKEMQGAFLWWD